METKVITIIVAKDCRVCHLTEQWLREMGKDAGFKIEFEELDCEEDPKAVDLAVRYDLNDVPAFIINGRGFSGMDFKCEEVIAALKDT